MQGSIGARTWAIAEGYIPSASTVVPKDTPYAAVIESDQPIVVQHTRLDSRQPALALLSTVAHPA